MYQNNNRRFLKEIAQDNYKNHRARNLTAIFAIFLTTLLITAVCTVGTSFLSTSRNAGEQTPGPMSDGYISGGQEQLEKILESKGVKWADLVQICSSAPLHNEAFGGVETKLYAPDSNFYHDNLLELKTGVYPVKSNEILISDSLAESLGISEQVGTPFTLKMIALRDGEEKDVSLPLIICGIYKNPLFSISSIYEEIYASPGFREAYNPELPTDEDIIYVKLKALNPLLFKSDVDGRLADLNEAVGAKGYSSGKYSADLTGSLIAVIPVFVLVLLLMASGYFLIYNVFYISVTSDIRWFGMMKTIGGTRTQLKKIMARQVRRMTFIGVVTGVAAGYLVGIVAARRVMDMTDMAVYYRNPPFLPAAVLSAAFAVLTVKISASRPLKIASGISPVEAAHYTPRRKKGVLSVISLALSGLIFLAVSNAVIGYQVEKYVDRYNQNDYQILHKSSLWSLEESYQPISEGLTADLKELPFVEEVDTVYMARTGNLKSEWNYYEESTGEIETKGKLWEYVNSMTGGKNAGFYPGNGIPWINERGNLKVGIFGMPPERWSTEQVNYHTLEGSFDTEKFATGEYVIYNKYILEQSGAYYQMVPDKEKEIHVGDILELSFYDSDEKVYKSRSLTVMAVTEPAHEYSSSDIASAVLVLPDTLFRDIYSGYGHLTASLQVSAREELNADQAGQIKELINREHSNQLQTCSRLESYRNAYKNRTTYALMGFFLAGVLAVIGISNVVNTITADVFAHRMEYAVMQSVGMTNRQLFAALFLKAMKLCAAALIIMLPAGAAAAVILAGDSLFTGFNAKLHMGMSCVVTAVIVALAALLSGLLSKNLSRKSVVSRLRETE